MGILLDAAKAVLKPAAQVYEAAVDKVKDVVTDVLPKGDAKIDLLPNVTVTANLGKFAKDAIGTVGYILNPVDTIMDGAEALENYVKSTGERLKYAYSSPENFMKAAAGQKMDMKSTYETAALPVASILPAGTAVKAVAKPLVKSSKAAVKAAKKTGDKAAIKAAKQNKHVTTEKYVAARVAAPLVKHPARRAALDISRSSDGRQHSLRGSTDVDFLERYRSRVNERGETLWKEKKQNAKQRRS